MNGKPHWFPLFATQFLGVLNDNFLKNCIIFISIYWLAEKDQGMVIPLASALLVLPFVLLSPLAGKMSQVYSKQKIYEYAKLAEIPIMAIAVIGFFWESMAVVMVSLFLMGVQSAIYAPSKYGLIRDVGGTEGLSFGVGTMELLTFLGVLMGQVAAGLVSDMNSGFTALLSAILIVFAIGGYITSRMIKVEEEKPLEKPKDPVEPITFLFKTARWAKSIKGLNTTILGLGSFWLVAGMIQMNIYEHAPKIYELSNTSTSLVMALIAIGIGLGCFIAGKLSHNRVELGMVPLGGIGLSIILTLFATMELSLNYFIVYLVLAAIFSGFYKVPLSAWIQERVEGRKLGLALAFNQLVAFIFILAAAGIFGYVVNKFDTYAVFAVLAVVSWIMTIIAMANIPAMMLRFVSYILANTYFKFSIHGSEHIPRRTGAVIVANHLSLLDPFFMVVAAPRMLRFVMARGLYEFWAWHWLMKRLNMIPISGGQDKEGLQEFNAICQQEVNQNHVLCIFPEGQISRIGHLLEFKRGIEHIAKGTEAPIIPVQMEGVIGVPLSFEVGTSKPIKPLLSNFRKEITIEIGEPMPATSPSILLRQRVQLLSANTFGRRIKDHHTIPYFLKRTAKKYGKKVFQYGSEEFSFSGFYSKTRAISGYWQKTTKDHVGINIGDHPLQGLIQASCILSGKIPVVIPMEMESSIQNQKIEEYGIDLVLTENNLNELYNTQKEVSHDYTGTDTIGIYWEYHGTEWIPISMTHRNILASVKGLMQLIKDPESSKVFSGFPGYTTYGVLTNTWFPYFLGMQVDTKKPDSISQSGVNTLFAPSEIVESILQGASQESLGQLDYVLTGNIAINPELKHRLEQENVFVSDSLGVPLGGVTVAVNTPDFELLDIGGNPLKQEGNKSGSKGRSLPGIAIRVVDSQGKELPPEENGELHVYGAAICDSHKDEEGWLHTGVQVSYDREGFLHLLNQNY